LHSTGQLAQKLSGEGCSGESCYLALWIMMWYNLTLNQFLMLCCPDPTLWINKAWS
jgi:hypothetical protein